MNKLFIDNESYDIEEDYLTNQAVGGSIEANSIEVGDTRNSS